LIRELPVCNLPLDTEVAGSNPDFKEAIMSKETIAPEDVHRARGYSHAIRAGNTIYVSGQIGMDGEGNIVEGDCGAQAHQALENMKRVLEAAGATMQDVVRLNYYFTNIADDLSKIANAYSKYFGRHYPAATVVQVGSLAYPGLLLEVEAIAVID
jgi:reactive intermediate/imine deaminase